MPTDPLFDRHNVIKATIIAVLSMATSACILFTPYVPIYVRIVLACLNLGITNFAANTNLHITTAPVVSTENIETVNVQQPAPEPPPAPIPGDRPAVRKGPRALN